jgi:ABC-type nitrate/sulfonate/bicarbonate transport system substrate-binding protein
MSRQFAKALSVALLPALWLVAAAGAKVAARVRLNTFPNAKALPFHAGLAKGIARHGIALDLAFTESSKNQRDGLAVGRFDIAHLALDNAVAMIEVARQDDHRHRRRQWDERVLFERYIAAFVAALRWMRDPAHRAEAVGPAQGKVQAHRRGGGVHIHLLVDPAFGFNGDARFDPEGFRNLLALRAEIQRRDGEAVAPEAYVDLGYFDRAIQRLERDRR